MKRELFGENNKQKSPILLVKNDVYFAPTEEHIEFDVLTSPALLPRLIYLLYYYVYRDFDPTYKMSYCDLSIVSLCMHLDSPI